MKPILDIPTFFPKMALVVIIKSFLPYFSLFLDEGMEEVASSKNILGKERVITIRFPFNIKVSRNLSHYLCFPLWFWGTGTL